MHAATSTVENSTQGSSCKLKFVHAYIDNNKLFSRLRSKRERKRERKRARERGRERERKREGERDIEKEGGRER
jgi:hypothetical protein